MLPAAAMKIGKSLIATMVPVGIDMVVFGGRVHRDRALGGEIRSSVAATRWQPLRIKFHGQRRARRPRRARRDRVGGKSTKFAGGSTGKSIRRRRIRWPAA